MSLAREISTLVASMGDGPVFVHSDPFRAARLVPALRDREAYLDAHLSLLAEVASDRALWQPAFNYDFPSTCLFDVGASESQLGPMPERFRTTRAHWRTPVPIFSVSGVGPRPSITWGSDTDPFGESSIFAELVRMGGVIVYYGSTFHYNTLIHHAERLAGGPLYRYDKIFPGQVVMADGKTVDGSLKYHVRPLGTGLEYDWPRLLEEALDAGVCRPLQSHPEVLAASARELCSLWVMEMKGDPFALLDENTRQWAEPAIDDLGRRFVIGDFEATEPIGSPA